MDLSPVLRLYPPLAGTSGRQQLCGLPVCRLEGGLINDTFRVGADWVLQRKMSVRVRALSPQ